MSELLVDRTPFVAAWRISGAQALDTIYVYWWNGTPGVGSVTITCYGQAWTAYFGAMGGWFGNSERTIQQFFARADTHYLIGKLGITPILKQRKSDHAYLGRIIEAVKLALKEDA